MGEAARTLVAGFGNELRGDDGFGVAVIRALAQAAIPPHVELIEVGTGGIRLAQELLGRYDRLIIVDAMHGGRAPGTLYVHAVERVADAQSIDLHLAYPSRAMTVAKALGVLPAEVFIVGCEPENVDELTLQMTDTVERAVPRAVGSVLELLAPSTNRASKECAR